MSDFAKLVLDADTRGLKRGEQDLKNFGAQSGKTARDVDHATKLKEASFGKIARMLGPAALLGAITGAAVGFGYLIRQTINTADEISKAAQKIGIATEELSRLRYAADLSGISFQELQVGVRTLSRNMLDTSTGTGEARKAFERMGISVKNTDGTLRTSTQVLGDMADKFADMPDGAEKTALAMQVLGRSGAQMIPLLNGGREALERLTSEADKFGIVIDADTGRKAEAFNDNLTRLRGVFGALATQIMADMLPTLVRFTDMLVRNAGVIRDLGQAISGAITFVGNLGRGVGELASRFSNLINASGLSIGGIEGFRSAVVRAIGPLGTLLGMLGKMGAAAGNRDAVGLGAAGSMKGLSSIIAESGVEMNRAANDAGEFNENLIKLGGSGRAAAGGVDALSKASDEAYQKLQRLRREFASVQEQLDPQLAQDRRRASQQGTITDAGRAGVGTQEERLRALGQTMQVFDALAIKVDDSLFDLAKAANDNTRKIGDSFGMMADRALGALDRLANGIRSGGFLDILGGILSLGLSLGGMGVFGKGVQTNIRAQSFDGGGFTGTGARSGGVDGKGGFPAILHPNETVIDHTKGGGRQSVVIINNSAFAEAFVDERVAASAPAIMQGASQVTQAQMARQARRRA